VLDHLSGDDVLVSLIRRSVQQRFLRILSGEGKRGKRVHDEVDPKQLNGEERRLNKDAGTNESCDKSDDVDGELELEELSNVIVDVSSPHAGLHNGSEVVIHHNDVSCMFGHICPSYPHGEPYIGLLQGWGIISSIASDSNNISLLSKSSHKQVLVFRSGSGQDSQGLPDRLKRLLVCNSFIDFVGTTIAGSLLLAILAYQSSHPFIELRSFHNLVSIIVHLIWVYNVAFLSNGHGSDLVVSRDHSDHDSSPLAFGYSIRHFLPDDILDSHNRYQNEACVFNHMQDSIFSHLIM